MCLAIPRKVLERAPGRVRVDEEGTPRWVAVPPGLQPEVGGYVAVYAGIVTELVETSEAEERLAFIRDLGELFGEEGAA